jgi:small GTP-binding protein
MCDTLIKLVVVGDSSVGKTHLIRRWSDQSFDESSQSTIGISYQMKTVSVDDIDVKVQICDTAGDEKFNSLAPAYFRGAHAALVVYDVTSDRSFASLDNWLKQIHDHTGCSTVILIVGNKCDLIMERAVAIDDGERYAGKYDFAFMETSAKDGVNINESFSQLIKLTVQGLMSKKIENITDDVVELKSGVKITESFEESCNC